jgi:iron complex outermembrane receptor protein
MASMKLRSWACPLTIVFVLIGRPAFAQVPTASLGDISLEDLLAVEVTSVSKKEQALFRAPSAIAVITGEDIRRAGAISIPEALRLVPGLQVASLDGNKWAVSARGFNSLYANKLLVLIDGRSIYNATNSGVHWDMQDVPVEDIERIEVIRGPGAALWGANAVNGVINIITKPARLTQGGHVSLSAGTLDRGSASVRYGGRVGPETYYRFYTKYFSRDRTKPHLDGDPADDWRVGHVGFRVDAQLSAADTLFAAASYSKGDIGQRGDVLTSPVPFTGFTSREPLDATGIAAQVRWNRTLSPSSDMFVQASFDEARRDEVTIGTDYDVINVDVQHHFTSGRHDVVWGAGQRLTADSERGTFMLSVTPAEERVGLTNIFAQDEITIVPSVVTATIGSKFEYSTLNGGNIQPNARISVSPTPSQNIWGAVSHAVRTPSRIELGMRLNYAAFPGAGLPVLLSILGNPDFEPEHLTAFEAGYRVQPVRRVQIDTTIFYNRYRDLVGLEPVTFVESLPAPTHVVVGLRFANHDRAETYGMETLVRVEPMRRWTIEASHSRLRANFLDTIPGATTPVNANSPTQQWHLASRLTLPADVEVDATLYRVAALVMANAPAYSRLDLRLGWTFRGNLGLSLVGQNLLDSDHLEFNLIDGRVGSRIPRTAAAKVTWQF